MAVKIEIGINGFSYIPFPGISQSMSFKPYLRPLPESGRQAHFSHFLGRGDEEKRRDSLRL
jgi:hypothetical protein